MRTSITSRNVAALLLIAGAVSCAPSEKTQQVAESTAATAEKTAVSAAGEVMSARREAQPYLDSARASFLAKKNPVAAAALRQAAAFASEQAGRAAEPAKTPLSESATELEALAARVAAGKTHSVKALDYAFARMHVAEAAYHCTRAMDAWKQGTRDPAAGAELIMLADHFERAAADAGQPIPPSANEALIQIRGVADRLTRGAFELSGVDAKLAAMDKEVHKLMAIVASLKA